MPKDDLPTTLWLDRERMEQARENFWRAWLDSLPREQWVFTPDGRVTVENVEVTTHQMRVYWNVAWAAAIAAFDFMMNGRLGPK